MNAPDTSVTELPPPAEALLLVNDLFAALVMSIKRAVINELVVNELGNLNSRLNDIERSLDPEAFNNVMTKEKVNGLIEDALGNYNPTEHTDFEDEVLKIVTAEIENNDTINDAIKDFINDKVSVDICISR